MVQFIVLPHLHPCIFLYITLQLDHHLGPCLAALRLFFIACFSCPPPPATVPMLELGLGLAATTLYILLLCQHISSDHFVGCGLQS